MTVRRLRLGLIARRLVHCRTGDRQWCSAAWRERINGAMQQLLMHRTTMSHRRKCCIAVHGCLGNSRAGGKLLRTRAAA
jgi:hypothetical protein